MITVNIRKQGGAAIMTIPADVLKMLNVEVGATIGTGCDQWDVHCPSSPQSSP
jgi:antitoxin component of MazEF toxin-antitoxin module